MVITTPAGQLHELGALLAAATASYEGWNVTYLGPNLAAEEIAAAVIQNQARALGLSIVYPMGDPRLVQELIKMKRCLPGSIWLLAGGRATDSYHDVLESIGARVFKSITDFRSNLASNRINA